MTPRFLIRRDAGTWSCEYRDATGRVVIRKRNLPTIDAAMAEVDTMRKAPVIVAPARTTSTIQRAA